MPSKDYELAIKDVLNSIAEMREDGDYDEDTLEALEWRISPPKECSHDYGVEKGISFCMNCGEFEDFLAVDTEEEK